MFKIGSEAEMESDLVIFFFLMSEYHTNPAGKEKRQKLSFSAYLHCYLQKSARSLRTNLPKHGSPLIFNKNGMEAKKLHILWFS